MNSGMNIGLNIGLNSGMNIGLNAFTPWTAPAGMASFEWLKRRRLARANLADTPAAGAAARQP